MLILLIDTISFCLAIANISLMERIGSDHDGYWKVN